MNLQPFCRLAACCILFTLLLNACKNEGGGADDDAALKNIAVNADFENAPPIASDINLEVLKSPIKGNNVRFTAQFDDFDAKTTFHALMVGEEKLVLRDDGKGGDVKAGDKIFSILLKEDLAALGKELSASLKPLEGMIKEQRSLLRFSGRSAEVLRLDEKIVPLLREPVLRPELILPLDIFAGGATTPADPLLKDHSLMITDLSVVEDPTRTFNPCSGVGNPNGVWTFGKLMTDMANGSTPTDNFVRSWLNEWLNAVTVNSDPIPARTALLNQVIVPWIQRSGGTGPITLANWQTKPLDVTKAPFKLTAIVNRMDLGGNRAYGRSNSGEGRFVFSVVTCSGPGSIARPFNIIFEYGLPLSKCPDIKAYAQQWINLKTMTIGTAPYNAALEALTTVFAKANASPSRVNGSALNQLRTNEISLAGPWELREFTLDATSRTLKSATVKQEPALKYNRIAGASAADQATLANYANTNALAIKNVRHRVPELFASQPFLGAKAHTLTPLHFWDAATSGAGMIVDNEVRHKFSLSTCSGCHGGEADTRKGGFIGAIPGFGHPDFVHVGFVPFGQKATLSGFLIGDPSDVNGLFMVNDPAGRGGPRGFNDLEDRARKLEATAAQSCLPTFKTLELAAIVKTRTITAMEH
jgi:hypothetical protein